MSKAASNTSASGESASLVDELIHKSGKPAPKKGKALKVLRALIEADGGHIDDRQLMLVGGTDYIALAVASMRSMSWIITTSSRLVKDGLGRRVRRTSYALNHRNNNITPND